MPDATRTPIRVTFETGGQEEGCGRPNLHALRRIRAAELDDIQAGIGLVVGEVAQVSMEEENLGRDSEDGGEGRHERAEKTGGGDDKAEDAPGNKEAT